MYSDGLLKLPIFTIQKNHKILLTVYSLSPRIFFLQFLNLHDNMILMLDVNLILTSKKIKVKRNKKCGI